MAKSLFQEVEHIKFFGPRLSEEAEVLHEIEDYFRNVAYRPVVRKQIKKVLEFVPGIFPKDWKCPEDYYLLTPEEQRAYCEIAKNGVLPCSGPDIQKIIELAVKFRAKHGR